MMKHVILAAAAAAVAMPAGAQVSQIESSNPAPKGHDPNAKICERIVKTGSRLGSSTVCMTANEWKDLRQVQREDVERKQRQAPLPYEH